VHAQPNGCTQDVVRHANGRHQQQHTRHLSPPTPETAAPRPTRLLCWHWMPSIAKMPATLRCNTRSASHVKADSSQVLFVIVHSAVHTQPNGGPQDVVRHKHTPVQLHHTTPHTSKPTAARYSL
jgi:hypothetical protein